MKRVILLVCCLFSLLGPVLITRQVQAQSCVLQWSIGHPPGQDDKYNVTFTNNTGGPVIVDDITMSWTSGANVNTVDWDGNNKFTGSDASPKTVTINEAMAWQDSVLSLWDFDVDPGAANVTYNCHFTGPTVTPTPTNTPTVTPTPATTPTPQPRWWQSFGISSTEQIVTMSFTIEPIPIATVSPSRRLSITVGLEELNLIGSITTTTLQLVDTYDVLFTVLVILLAMMAVKWLYRFVRSGPNEGEYIDASGLVDQYYDQQEARYDADNALTRDLKNTLNERRSRAKGYVRRYLR